MKIGEIPVMLKSKTCNLDGLSDKGLTGLKECIYDQGGYFIVKGTEKVLIAGERAKMNGVLVYKKKKDVKFSWTAEIRSQEVNNFTRPASVLYLNMYRKKLGDGGASERRASNTMAFVLPKLRDDVPILIVFRALGFETDKSILEHIVYDMDDRDMLDLLVNFLMFYNH
jgi:DNA-directed RNA polymerase II subunit RPB2